jgi:general L-amino acid transport system permease protein
MTTHATTPLPQPASFGPADAVQRAFAWLRTNLFSTWYNTLFTVGSLWLIWEVVSRLYHWGFATASFGPGPQSCQGIDGACWAMIRDMWPLFLLGAFPADERWRPALVLALLAALVAVSLWPRARASRGFVPVWIAGLAICYLLMRGGAWLGIEEVDTTRWGGLVLTVLLTIVGLAVAFPFSIVLALGRRSRMPVIKSICVAYIELIRGVPLITILFMASVMLPLFFPSGFNLDRVVRAQVGILMFSAAYLAEVVRGGLQGVSRGQEEAAQALGLGYWQTMILVILPQALRLVIPALVGTFIALLKDTSLVAIIGLFELLGMAIQVVHNPDWLGKLVEAYVFTAAIYWGLCFAMSRYSRGLEQRFKAGQN